MNSKDIRQTFLDFFREKGHTIVPSAPMVLKNDPTLMFTNAGMNQFKDLFLGNKPVQYSRIADTQKCLRVSGKHNDLEEVGLDTYHHTMFEMLGNWSFGDYFKAEAIAWAWELLTERYKISKDKLYVTYFGGDAAENMEPDMEARDLWKQFIDENRIIPGNKKDNFWEMGDTGPCGPCSEIHVDIRDEAEIARVPGRDLVNMGHPQVIEIWNLVFMQFNRMADGRLQLLPNQHVDTGMGFERLSMALQGKKSNYDTDIFTPYIFRLEVLSGIRYGTAEKSDIAMRVIADHIRAVGVAIADGQLPSNTGAGYVIRRILRRAIRYGYSFLSLQKPFIHLLVDELDGSLGEVFPEIRAQKDFITKVILEEETSFLRTLETGLGRLKEITGKLQGKTIPGETVFELYDTFGFPADLTRLIAAEQGLDVDEVGFDNNLAAQKERSKSAGKISAGDWVQVRDDVNVEFIGYDFTWAEDVYIVKYRMVQQKGKDICQLVLNKTPFYAESGGQVGDKGRLVSMEETLHVLDTVKENDLIIHIVNAAPKNALLPFRAEVDTVSRTRSMNNHSATHLLHAALRQVLGTHVEQRGSLVNPDYLRFDFSHHSKLTDEELGQIEHLVNVKIRANIPLKELRNVPISQAKEMGAMALFGEKYGDFVRVIIFDDTYSVELCGGTHVSYTGQIGYCKIVTESSVAAGVRRIEAITGGKAEEFINEQLGILDQLKELLKNPKDPLKGAEFLLKENETLRREVEGLKARQTQVLADKLKTSISEQGGMRVLFSHLDGDADMAKDIAYAFRKEISNLYMVLGTIKDGKAQLLVALGDDLVKKGMDAVKIVKEIASEIQGGGGGQNFLATAGGKNPAGLQSALDKARTLAV